MSDMTGQFSRKEWKDCCGKGCKKCSIAQAYIGAHGRSDGLKKLREDRKAVLAAKSAQKKKGSKKKRGGKKKSGKKKN